MRRLVSQAALEAAVSDLVIGLELQGIRITNPTAVARRTIVAYLHALAADHHRKSAARRDVSPHSWGMANLQVGESYVTAQPTSIRVVRQRVPTARVLAQNEDLSIKLETLFSGQVRATRLPDGSRPEEHRDLLRNPVAAKLATLEVGDSWLFPDMNTKGKNQVGSNHKDKARRILNNPRATWKLRQTNKGVRATRLEDNP